MVQITQEQLDEYELLKQNVEFVESTPSNMGLPYDKIKTSVTSHLADKTPILVPKNTLIMAAGGVATLVLLTWPVLIVTFLLGCATVVKLGCPCGLTGKENKS